jgi:threonine aldolase
MEGKMYSFKNDYSEGAHPRILSALVDSNLEQTVGYGEDYYTQKACELIKQKIDRDDAAVHLLIGGTQTNLTAISAFLKPYEAAIAVSTGHILVHETGAIEATGHKIISVESSDGKLRVEQIKKVIEAHTDEHMVKPKLVYISNSTEIGTIYKKNELEAISKFCRENDLILYLDGARLGSALALPENDITLTDLAKLTDAFYIGGTKNGALIGEALVICKDSLKEDFRFSIKQKGAMLAKGRILGIQFLELFKDNLYFDIAKHANEMAVLLVNGIMDLGYSFFIDSPSNQIFPMFPDYVIEKLNEKYLFEVWQKIDDNNTIIRLVTSWATEENQVLNFIQDLKNIR